MSSLRFELPDELLEQLVERVADRVLERLAEERAETAAAPGPWLTVPEAAAYARTSAGAIYNARSSGKLTRYGQGRKALVSREELDRWIARDRVAQALPMGSRSRSTSGGAR